MRYTLIVAAILLAAGCADDTDRNAKNMSTNDVGVDAQNNPTSDAGNNGNDADNAADGGDRADMPGGGSDAGPDMTVLPSPCPDALPTLDAACDLEGLRCEYGDDPRAECRELATCDDGAWDLDLPQCDPLPAVMCPATRDDASGEDCDTMDAYCSYGDLNCHCTNCVDGPVVMCGGDPTWMCDVPNSDPDCPQGKPRLGSGCVEEGKSCRYECGPDGARTCRTGVWNRSDGGPCPISTARVKRDIRYLDADELDKISDALQAIPLARYEYTDPSIGRGEKLGFIIEDLPASTPAVDRQRLMVDLYGYTSMLVADAQAREKRMRVLEKRLADLEAKALQCAE